MMNDQAMFAMGLPGGMRERVTLDDDALDGAAVRDVSPNGVVAPEITVAPKSAVDLDTVVIELKAAAATKSAEPDEGVDEAEAAALPQEEAEAL